jgi:hypothetical protein
VGRGVAGVAAGGVGYRVSMSSDPEDLTSAAGDDVNAGIMLSGVGGEPLETEDEDAGLRPVEEQGERIGWGHLAR